MNTNALIGTRVHVPDYPNIEGVVVEIGEPCQRPSHNGALHVRVANAHGGTWGVCSADLELVDP